MVGRNKNSSDVWAPNVFFIVNDIVFCPILSSGERK